MISNQILQNTIDGLKGITRTDLCVIDVEGKILAATFPNAEAFIEPAQAFVASPADSQVINGCQFFKVFDDHQLEYVLLAYGDSEDVYMIGKIASFQIQNLLVAYKERFDIQRQKLLGQYSRKNLDKLLTLVNSNIVSDEENWTMFQANFDRIHENFFRNLKLQYTDLTSGDLRFCALLRLNMPTKEIAKLLNISTRGVDAARYRLRKKFNLLPEESLTDFLINFK